MNGTPLIVVAGPTCTGKTGAALALASTFDGELVGADSVQVYRGFDIGSAKPRSEELGSTPHHLIDVIEPNEEIDAAAYAALADRAIAGIGVRGRVPIVVGGTGLWIRALLRGLVDVPAVDSEIRERLEREGRLEGSQALHARLGATDPLTAATVHPNDLFRIVRALEVFEQTGIPLGELRRQHSLGRPRYRAVFVTLDMDRDAHDEALSTRIDAMLKAGWIDEVAALRARWGDDVRPFGSVGYREVLEHVRDGLALEETKRRIRKSTRTYARRQRTWFRGEPGVSWSASATELAEQTDRIAMELGL